jgi:prolyl-tRNA synthetase
MKFSNLFFANTFFEQDNAQLELTELARKACFLHQDASGVFSLLTLGLFAQRRLEALVREEMDRAGFCETRLSLLQDAELWRRSERWDAYGEEMMRVQTRSGRQMCLGATCEELAASVVKSHYDRSNMSVGLYQIGNKYRDELRARGGLVRAKEFVMKDAYSFHSSEEGARAAYQAVREAYLRIFSRLGLEAIVKSGDNGEIGGRSSEEFHVLSELGDDKTDGQASLECGHVFDLGDRYSRALDLRGGDGSFVRMGCYGIGVSRLAMLLLSRQRDARGFWGSEHFAAFDTVITVLDWGREENRAAATRLYETLRAQGASVLLDDRLGQAGKKLADAELIGCRRRVVVSKRAVESGRFELMDRRTLETRALGFEELAAACA